MPTVAPSRSHRGEDIGRFLCLPTSAIYGPTLFATLNWTAIVALVAIGGGVAIAQFSISRVTRPLRELAAVMAEVGVKQDFSHRVAPARADAMKPLCSVRPSTA